MENTTRPKKNTQASDNSKQPGYITMDMPEVKDIPGQENVTVPRIREMEDTTISSSDEEGDGLLDDLNSDDRNISLIDSSDVTSAERKALKQAAGHQPTEETADFKEMVLDERDNDGDLLNEKSIRQDRTGNDLDTPGADLDDADENIGEEDEENNMYSQSQRDQ